MEIKDAIQGFSMQWALYFVAVYVAIIISNAVITLTATIVICALLSFFAAIVTTMIFLVINSRLGRLEAR